MDKKEIHEDNNLNKVITAVLNTMENTEPGTPEYGKLVSQLSTLYRMKETDLNVKMKVIDTLNKQEKNELECKNLIQENELKAKKAELEAQEAREKREESVLNQRLRRAEARIKEREANSKLPVKADTAALIAGNLAGIVLILGYEHAHVITSKALGFVAKLK